MTSNGPQTGIITVAVFDVDGTLTCGESLFRFLRVYLGPGRLLLASATALGRVVRRPGQISRDTGKAALLNQAMQGRDAQKANAAGVRFASWLVANRLQTDASIALRAHQHAGHRTVLISASPSIYIEPLGELLGVDAAFGTELAVDDLGRYTGQLLGSNLRGRQKVAVLERWLSQQQLDQRSLTLFAYGDSAGDDELLRAAGINAHDRRVCRNFPIPIADAGMDAHE